MRLVVTGVNGQLGWELVRSLAPLGEVVALRRDDLDLEKLETIVPKLRELKADVVVNAAAYTAVDQAETNETIALRINGEAVDILAAEAARSGSLLVHYSTDYVFDGAKNGPYVEADPVAPLNAYGRSKAYGEDAVKKSAADWLTFRTTWVYAARGHNFMRTMIRLAGEREVLRIVSDQRGAPTSARFLADASAQAIRVAIRERRDGKFESGLFHLSTAGETTWHGFASTIVETLQRRVPDAVKTKRIEAIASTAYPTPAQRPKNSLLDCSRFVERFDLHPVEWPLALSTTLEDVLTR